MIDRAYRIFPVFNFNSIISTWRVILEFANNPPSILVVEGILLIGAYVEWFSHILLVRVRRIELRSQVWKTCILAVVLHPRSCLLSQLNRGDYITNYDLDIVHNCDVCTQAVKTSSNIFVATIDGVHIT